MEQTRAAEEARARHRLEVLTGPKPSLDAPLMRQIISRGAVTAAGALAYLGAAHLLRRPLGLSDLTGTDA